MIDNCNAGNSGMEKCPGLIGGVNDPSTSCNIQSPVNEQIHGILTALPGNNPVTGWGTSGGSSTTPSTAGPTNPTIPNWTYTGCYTDANNARVLSGITFANLGLHNTTTTGCVAYCDAKGYRIAGTEYAGQCFCDNSLANSSMKVGNDECNMACKGDGRQLCGGSGTLSVYKKGTGARKEKRERKFGRRGFH
jgi:hypothetical protein